MTAPTTIDPARLPAVVRAYLNAQVADTAIRSCTDEAVVVDDGRTHRGPVEILAWLRRSATEYRYTATLTGAQRVDDERWVAMQHLEGDFPGGVVDLRYAFVLAGGRIAELTITPVGHWWRRRGPLA